MAAVCASKAAVKSAISCQMASKVMAGVSDADFLLGDILSTQDNTGYGMIHEDGDNDANDGDDDEIKVCDELKEMIPDEAGNTASTSVSTGSRVSTVSISLDLSRLATTLNMLERSIQIGINTGPKLYPVISSLIHIESRKLPTAVLFDVDIGRISIVTVNTKEYHSDVLA
ncbi:hypothetical protein Tco_1393177 [Tanacetum coccineum]